MFLVFFGGSDKGMLTEIWDQGGQCQDEVQDDGEYNLRGTTSRASAASSYSTKPKPFISLISLMVPGPSVKKLVTSSLVTALP